LCSKHYAYKIKLLKKISIFQRLLAIVILFMKTNSTTLPDSLLVKQYIDGSELALENLINRHQARVFNFINSKVQDRDTAEDIFQDTFIKVIKTIKNGQYNEEGKFLPWIMRIAHNLVIDFFRMSFKEIAENTNVSINTALGRMRYAIINLRKLIEQNQIILNT